jgi:hypothetical protein
MTGKHRGEDGRGNVPHHPRPGGCGIALGVPAIVALWVFLRRR